MHNWGNGDPNGRFDTALPVLVPGERARDVRPALGTCDLLGTVTRWARDDAAEPVRALPPLGL